MYVSSIPKDNVNDALEQAADAQLEAQPFDSWDDDVAAQQAAAKSAAVSLVQEVRGAKVNITVTGHARQNEQQVDSIAVSVIGVVPVTPAKK